MAERFRAVGSAAPGMFKRFAEFSTIAQAEGARDQPTCDLLTQRMPVHEWSRGRSTG